VRVPQQVESILLILVSESSTSTSALDSRHAAVDITLSLSAKFAVAISVMIKSTVTFVGTTRPCGTHMKCFPCRQAYIILYHGKALRWWEVEEVNKFDNNHSMAHHADNSLSPHTDPIHCLTCIAKASDVGSQTTDSLSLPLRAEAAPL